MVALRFVQSESEQVVLKHANQGYLFLQWLLQHWFRNIEYR
jgi:hypothetical protein